ncbi:MAG: hypothetical protein H8E13_00745, partial [Actinobacteria bacterium]|nr:hypothetical protein [Actinomycetota bacterium]
LIINSVSFADGKKYKGTRESLRALKKESDMLCRRYGLSVGYSGNHWTPNLVFNGHPIWFLADSDSGN